MYQDAIKDYSNVIKQDTDNIHALHNRGISFERLGKYKEAVKDFSSVIEIDP
jgi:tetratricopeptide (TPR) repeat protein